MFDYNKVYYKVTNRDEIHYNFKYKDGLNVLQDEFDDNPRHSCCAGGLYFTDYNNLYWYIDMITDATYIREVTIPQDARVIQDPEGDKWRSDKIIFGERYHLWDDFTKWFDSERWNWENGSVVLARCFNCHIDKWWDPEKFNWEYGSPYLAGYCYRYFSKWWDPEKFNWEDGSYCLARYCSDYFTKWWDPEKFDWAEKCFLETYCQQYKEIWGNNKY